MFCEECGTKNKKNATFCENCGHKMTAEESKKETKSEKTETKVVKKVVKEKEPMSQKTKILIGSIAAVVAIIIGAYFYLASIFKPEKIAIKYFKAYASKDANKICDIVKLEEDDFVNKKLLSNALKGSDIIELENYKVEKNDSKSKLAKAFGIKEDDLSKTITIRYTKKGSSKEYTKNIKLVKGKNKKFLFFDDWKVDSSDLIAKDFTISVPSNTEATIDGIKIPKKYQKDSYSSSYKTYKIPAILKGKHQIEAELKSGIKLSGETSIFGNYASFSYGSLKLDKKTEKKYLKDAEEKVKIIYDALIDGKNFDDIKDSFNEDYRSDIEYAFNTVKENAMNDYNKLKEFKITDSNVTYYYISEDELQLTIKIKYDYKVEYKNGDETKEYSKTGKTGNIYVNYRLDKKDITLSNIKSLVSYFSHYSF